MKLLIVTQKVDINDDVLGFFHGWIKEFAKHCEKVTVICLQKGEYDLPENVNVLSLGKERGASRLKYIFNFYKYIWLERKNYDAVFVHMNQEYVLLGGLLWEFWRKKTALWYVHKSVNWKLKLAEKLVSKIFTASKESFILPSKKVEITGHGIDLSKFKAKSEKQKTKKDKFRIIYVGRISKIKNQKLLVETINIIVNLEKIKNVVIDVVGSPITNTDKTYLDELKNLIKEDNLENHFNFVGSVPNKDIMNYYNVADLSVNLCSTGGVDKAVLESMLCDLPVVALNKTFAKYFGEYGGKLILKNNDANELADKILTVIKMSDEEKEIIGEKLRSHVVKNHNLDKLIDNIMNFYKKNNGLV